MTFSVLEITRGICENQNRTKLPQGVHNSELGTKTHRRDRWHQFALLSVKGEPGAPTGGQSPMQSWAASPWLTRDNFKVCVSSPLFWGGGEGKTVYQPLRYKCAALHWYR